MPPPTISITYLCAVFSAPEVSVETVFGALRRLFAASASLSAARNAAATFDCSASPRPAALPAAQPLCRPMCKESHMATNLSLDPNLLECPEDAGGERHKKAAVPT